MRGRVHMGMFGQRRVQSLGCLGQQKPGLDVGFVPLENI